MAKLKVYSSRLVKILILTTVMAAIFLCLHYRTSVIHFSKDRPVPNDGITVVTMYLDIGKFQKGRGTNYYTGDKYVDWMRSWALLTNPVVAFFEDEKMIVKFREIRSRFPEDQTVIVKVNRSQLHAFSHYDKIKQIYETPNYPKHPPNTVNANYSCTMSAKYDVMEMALDTGLVKTEYLVWLDIGYFRNLLGPGKNDTFRLGIPKNFNSSRIGFSEVGNRENMKSLKPWDFIQNNHVWVAGGFVLANHEVIRKFIRAYRVAVEELLRANMMSTDQQVIGAMYSPGMVGSQEVDVMTYSCSNGMFGLHSSDVVYFCLGYICKEAGQQDRSQTTAKQV
ncbi:unnamed protein product [Lymnaea stagnalis]|uniref:Uncharacterized protein n=1 Tax=Lymnaea stagnalis TaxID=6523 RepID=A0AAV2IM47_LYMST